MKKFLKLTLIVMFCFLLVGCDDKEKDTNNDKKNNNDSNEKDTSTYQEKGYEKLKDTLVGYNDATKDVYDLKMTVYFKDGKAANAKVILTFKDQFKSMIANMKETLSKNTSYQNFVVGTNTLTYDYTKEGFMTFEGKSKTEVKAELEKSNYTFD